MCYMNKLTKFTVFREDLSLKMPIFEAILIILGALIAWYA